MARTEKQKETDRKYLEKVKQQRAKFQTIIRPSELEELESILKDKDITKAEFVRPGIKHLKK